MEVSQTVKSCILNVYVKHCKLYKILFCCGNVNRRIKECLDLHIGSDVS